MRRHPSAWIPAVLGLLALLAGSPRAGAATPYRLLEKEERPLAALSPLARQAFDADKDQWVVGESARVLGFAWQTSDLAALLSEAEAALEEITRRLALPEPSGKVTLMLVRNESSWRRMVGEQGVRPDGLALHHGREILLKDDAQQRKRADRLPHELIHYRIREAFRGLPLWADEGVAGYFGVLIARSYRESLGRRLAGTQPAVDADDLLPFADVVGADAVPSGQAAARAFYRQAEELIAELAWQFGDEKLPPFLHRLADGEDWQLILRQGYGVDDQGFAALEQAVRRRSMARKDY